MPLNRPGTARTDDVADVVRVAAEALEGHAHDPPVRVERRACAHEGHSLTRHCDLLTR